mmetsp:Transcript_32283/g.36726  ORF Transcript_32283/g.36726 Transcript_32283/m.36726 type:complete len:291 (+) Transcript_32283:144-1016(+)|eukprot:CAMPEP_0194148072 /NCGR_PEP_ID=MMETSP0152-20130528/29959_1 /TAXON_ID=1049557 /ORGANISM="Thalassiothrix antarctica, Strain L6-D1" /LENGTH=290 /DNA_ID=CAMNT_0038849353 /DNA_START=37 /DNA_END=909 /DNA_ORIENTATION=+
MANFLRRVVKIRQLRKNSGKNILVDETIGKDGDQTNKRVGKRSMGSSSKSQSDQSLSKRSLNDGASTTAVISSIVNPVYDGQDAAIDSRNEQFRDENDSIFNGIREEVENEKETSKIKNLNDELTFFITPTEASDSDIDDDLKILSDDSTDEVSYDVSYATIEKIDDGISLDASSGGLSNFRKKKLSNGKKGFLRRIKDDLLQTVENFQRRVSRTTRMIIDEVNGTYLDTASASDQVCNAFTLQEDEINAVRKRLDKAHMHYDRRIDTLEPVMEMSSGPMSFECRVLNIF